MADLTTRILRAARLDVSLYEEVEADKGAFRQAMGVVVLSSLAAGIGTGLHHEGLGGAGAMAVGTAGTLIGWYVWAYLTYLVGTKLVPEPQTEADLGQLLRTTGFSSAPGLIRILGLVPNLIEFVFVLASIWMLVTMVIAVRQALDYSSTVRALGVCLVGWVVQALIIVLLFYLLGEPTMGVEI